MNQQEVMTPELQKELFDLRCNSDALFRRLVLETQREREKDRNAYQVGLSLIELALDGKVDLSIDEFGTLMYEKSGVS